MSDKKAKTNLERKLRWYFKNINPEIDQEMLEIILISTWNEDNSKLQLDPKILKHKFADIYEMAMKQRETPRPEADTTSGMQDPNK